jgi:hypothetical protein
MRDHFYWRISTMKKLLLATTLILALAPAVASAVTTKSWVVYGDGVNGSGQITLGAADNGGYDILSFTGAIDGNPVTLLGGSRAGFQVLRPRTPHPV